LAHNAGVCWPGKGFLKYPGVVEIEIGEPISTVDASVDEVHEQAVGWLVDKMKVMPDTP
jgi:1-acyl-sn-glycerol-3-phosphate acyltransferase